MGSVRRKVILFLNKCALDHQLYQVFNLLLLNVMYF